MNASVPDRDVWLLEYDKLKAEQIERIKQRDIIIYWNIIAIAALITVALGPRAQPIIWLSLPWVSISFGWAYLRNDEKVTALGRYFRTTTVANVGPAVLAWESGTKQATRWRGVHQRTQTIVDLLLFVGPAAVGVVTFLTLASQRHLTNPGIWVILGFEVLWMSHLALMILSASAWLSPWRRTSAASTATAASSARARKEVETPSQAPETRSSPGQASTPAVK